MTAKPEDAPQHGDARHQDDPPHAQAGYETTDAHAGATYRRRALHPRHDVPRGRGARPACLRLLAERETARPAARGHGRSRSTGRQLAAPAFPSLLTAEPTALADFRRQEDEILNSYAWVEKDTGIARIPIAEAMRIVGRARRCRPSRPPRPAT